MKINTSIKKWATTFVSFAEHLSTGAWQVIDVLAYVCAFLTPDKLGEHRWKLDFWGEYET